MPIGARATRTVFPGNGRWNARKASPGFGSDSRARQLRIFRLRLRQFRHMPLWRRSRASTRPQSPGVLTAIPLRQVPSGRTLAGDSPRPGATRGVLARCLQGMKVHSGRRHVPLPMQLRLNDQAEPAAATPARPAKRRHRRRRASWRGPRERPAQVSCAPPPPRSSRQPRPRRALCDRGRRRRLYRLPT